MSGKYCEYKYTFSLVDLIAVRVKISMLKNMTIFALSLKIDIIKG